MDIDNWRGSAALVALRLCSAAQCPPAPQGNFLKNTAGRAIICRLMERRCATPLATRAITVAVAALVLGHWGFSDTPPVAPDAKRTVGAQQTGGAEETVAALVKGLGDPRFSVREECQRKLVARGLEAAEAVSQAAASSDPEVAHRARTVLGLIDPVVVRAKILRIRPRPSDGEQSASVEMFAGESPHQTSESGEFTLARAATDDKPRTGARTSSAAFSVRYSTAGKGRMTLSVDETPAGSSQRRELLPLSENQGAWAVLKRGEELRYSQVAARIERERHPFILIGQWSVERRSAEKTRAAHPQGRSDALSTLAEELTRQASPEPTSTVPANPAPTSPAPTSTAPTSTAPRSSALEILIHLARGEDRALFVHAASEADPTLRIPALIGLARLGDAPAVDRLKEEVIAGSPRGSNSDAAEPAATPPPLTGPAPKPPLPGSTVFEKPDSDLWPMRAALELLERGDTAGFERFSRRLLQVASADLHVVLATMADRIPSATPAQVELVVEAATALEFLLQAPWHLAELEHFFGLLLPRVARPASSALDGAMPESAHALVRNLGRALLRESSIGPTRSRMFVRFWERVAGDAPQTSLAHEILAELVASDGAPPRWPEVAAWIGAAFHETPMPEPDGSRILERLAENAVGGDDSYRMNMALLDLARRIALTEPQMVLVANALAAAASASNQPYAAEILQELERITGLKVPPARTQAGPQAGSKNTNAAAQPPEAPSTPLAIVARWAASSADVHAAFEALQMQSAAAPSTDGELEYWEFTLLTPAQGGSPRPGTRGVDVGSETRVIEALRAPVTSGRRQVVARTDGSRTFVRLDPESSAASSSSSPSGPASRASRYRLNGHSTLEVGLPATIYPRGEENAVAWYEISDVHPEPIYLAKPNVPRVQKFAWLRHRSVGDDATGGAEGRTPRDAETVESLWKRFGEEFLRGIALLDDERKLTAMIPILRQIDLREAAPFLRTQLEKTKRPDLTRLLVELGDPFAIELLRKDLAAPEPARKLQAAALLLTQGDREALATALVLLKQKPPQLAGYHECLQNLDLFLSRFDPSPDERVRVLDTVVELLSDQRYSWYAFGIVNREADEDFGYQATLQVRDPEGRKTAQAQAVDAARKWWANARQIPPTKR